MPNKLENKGSKIPGSWVQREGLGIVHEATPAQRQSASKARARHLKRTGLKRVFGKR